jgi:PAS domain S-box-containing protein
VYATGEPLLVPVVTPEIARAAMKPEHHAYQERFPIHSSCIVPMQLGDRRLGAVTVWRTTPGRPLTPDDQTLLQELADRAALAVDNARILEQEHGTREQLAAILHGVADGITVQAPDGHLVYANDAAARLVGVPSAEALVSTDQTELLERFEMRDAHDRPFPWERLPGRRAAAGEVVGPTLIRFHIRATGEERSSLVAATPVRDGEGRVQFAVSIFHDVTEQQRTERRLRFLAEAGALLPSSLDTAEALDGVAQAAVRTLADWALVYLMRADETVEHVAVAHADPAHAALLRTFPDRYPPIPGDRSLIWQVLHSGEPVSLPEVPTALLERSARDPEHLRLMRALDIGAVIYAPLTTRGRVLGVLGLFTTRTGGRRFSRDDLAIAVEIARRAAVALDNARLYQAAQEALRVRDEFLTIASHELRTPITAIRATAQLLQRTQARRTLDDARLERFLRTFTEESERLGALADDLLDISRLRTGHLELHPSAVDVGGLVRRAVRRAQALSARHVLHADIARGFTILADAGRLEQVLEQLLTNAVKYSPDAGPIEVTVHREGEGVHISVRDAGIGLPEGADARIFQPFGRAPNAAARQIEGLGLGLCLARSIVERHGGRIWATSPGEDLGTTVHLWLPRGDRPSPSSTPAADG